MPDRTAGIARAAALAATLATFVATFVPAPVAAQPEPLPPIVGRWDLTATPAAGGGDAVPAWLEVERSGNRTLVGRVVFIFGSSRPVSRVEWANGTFRLAVPPQFDRGEDDLRFEGRLDGDHLAGTLVTPGGEQMTWTGRRAPSLRRAAAPRWGTPVRLVGRDLTGWTTQGRGENKWRVANGVLMAGGGGANLMTTRTFDDFKLHLEFRYPKGSNSGVYLRGRHEVQIEDDEGLAEPDSHGLGGVYGFLVPNEKAGKGPNVWQTYDITLVGRRVTVVLNGHTVICDQIIPGITGGAIDSDEGAPGPILLQGDHGKVEFRNLVLTPALTARSASR
jgi:hypothetical protein